MNIKSIYQFSGSEEFKNYWITACALALIVGIYVSSALMSIGMIATALLLLTPGALPQVFANIKAQPFYVLLMGTFFMYLVSGLYSDNMDYWSERLQIKLPYMLLPLSFAAFTLRKNTLNRILYFFFLTVLMGAIGSLINFALHYREITESYLHAKTMPTPFQVGHIRFSLMSTFSVFIGWVLYKDKYVFHWQWERYVILAGTIILFVFLHVLSVRSGLLAMYAGIIVYVFFETLAKHGVKRMLITLCLISLLPVGMYLVSPTLRNKVDYMVRDVSRFKDGKNVNNYSDGNRLLSWQLAWEIGNENPFIGVGIGDVRDKMNAIYETRYPYSEWRVGNILYFQGIAPHNKLIPHSQYMYIFAGCGFLGLFWFVATCFYPYFNGRLRQVALLMVFNSIVLTSFISESTLEIQLGVALHLFFMVLLVSNTNTEKNA